MKKKTSVSRSFISIGLPLSILALALFSRSHFVGAADKGDAPSSTTEIVTASEVNWTPLNAARGDASPQAGTLWGDRAGDPQTGFLVKFADGFSSPPHIHNVTYRGVVISGQIHNDDPEAAEMWMPAGSFWTQPAGEVHITAAKGGENMAFIEIDHGPYLVWPPERASDNGERPVNVHANNLVWLNADDTSWISADGPQLAFLWGKPEAGKAGGTLLKLPAGFAGEIRSTSSMKAVVIGGKLEVTADGNGQSKTLQQGSLIRSEGSATQRIQSSGEGDSLLYLRTDAPVKITSGQDPQ